MVVVLTPNDKLEITCPNCHIISSTSAWKNNHGYCPATNCNQYVHVWETPAQERARIRKALEQGYQIG